jgi:hypothetical protein
MNLTLVKIALFYLFVFNFPFPFLPFYLYKIDTVHNIQNLGIEFHNVFQYLSKPSTTHVPMQAENFENSKKKKKKKKGREGMKLRRYENFHAFDKEF